MDVDSSDKCTICLNIYTITDIHRPTSLECGHLFGNSCIKKWFNKQKTALCPTCTKKCRLRNLHPIYATHIVVNENDTSMEKIISLQEEKTKLEMENLRLVSVVELLQKELDKTSRARGKICTDFSAYKYIKKILFNSKERTAFVEYDRCDNVVLVTFCNNESFGLRKFDALNMNNMEVVFKIKYADLTSTANQGNGLDGKYNIRIKDLKISPFNDSTVILCYDNLIRMVNTANNSILFNLSLEEKITSLAYDLTDRNFIFAGDSKGNLYQIDLTGDISKEKISDCAIHSLHKINDVIYCGCVNAVYVYDKRMEKYEMLTVTNLTGDDKNVLVTVREKNQMIMHVMIESDGEYDRDEDNCGFNKHFFNFKECKRIRDRIFDDSLFIVNNEKKAVVIYDMFGNTIKILWSGDEILGFCLGMEKIFILTSKGFVIYGS